LQNLNKLARLTVKAYTGSDRIYALETDKLSMHAATATTVNNFCQSVQSIEMFL